MTINTTIALHRGKFIIMLAIVWLGCGAMRPLSASECEEHAARALSVQGRVEVRSVGESTWAPVQQNMVFCPGDRLRVGENSRAGLLLSNDTLLRLAEHSSVRISAPEQEGGAWLELMRGIAHFISRVKHRFQVDTPYVNASIEGTEFTVQTSEDGSDVTVLEGRVRAANSQGEVIVNGGERARALPGKAPEAEAVVDPLDAVQWALYYPPVIEPALERPSAELRRSYEAYTRGDMEGAFTALAQSGEVEREAALLVYRASLHLQVGATETAKRDLAAALKLEPEQADALALLSIISTVRNERQQALELAQRALASSPDGLSPLLALSYARQAQFQLPQALDAARRATEAAPESALAWSRLAQLHLMSGQLNAGTEAAWKAARIAPDQPDTMATLGFAHLFRLDLGIARQAFEKAVERDQGAPLPRLGLGLLETREGNLAEGRRQMEIAANLDPSNAVIRSYLGKGYYEEKRDKRAATQFELAKQFDELDPTPWYYNAIQLQSQNRPIEALRELQTSIDLNDNRAVYRSRFLLDQDEAARNASQARIYQDLGFEQLARNEAYKSLQSGAQTHSAHRLLSDSYSGQPLMEKARLSELLQSQLLQPLNSNPIQPQLAASKLGILDGAGPSSSGFSEYTPLFTRSGLDLQLNAIGGNNGTAGDDLILTGLGEKLAFSFGQFHYETDGWRDNNDLEQDIYDAFLQLSPNSSTSVQFEYRRQDAESGDLAFSFEPDDFSSIKRNDLEWRTGRIGIQHQFDTGGRLIASVIDQDILETATSNYSEDVPAVPTPFGLLPGTISFTDITTRDSDARTRELQFIQPLLDHRFTLGVGNYSEDFTRVNIFKQELSVPVPVPPFLLEAVLVDELNPVVFDPSFENAYLYSQLALPSRINLTLGVTREKFENAYIKTIQTNPKLGLTWEAMDNLTLRAAYLENLARPLHMEQSIEQTQVAGFNQLYDSLAGSEVEQFGVGADSKLSNNLSIGAEFIRRDLREPNYAISGTTVDVTYDDVDETLSRGYLYWMASDRLGVRLAHEREDFERETFSPQALTTQRTPLGLSYHWPTGIYLQAEGTYVDQEIKESGVTQQDDFWNVDAVVGYRFPKRYGKAEIIVKNLLDEEFSYYDLSFHTGDFLTPRYQPERQVLARFTINF